MADYTPWREIKHKRDQLAGAPDGERRPFRDHIDFCFAGVDEGDVLERVIVARR